VLSGRDGVDRYPQAEEPSLEHAVLHALRQLDPAVTLDFVQNFSTLYEEDEVLRARNATVRARPSDVRAFFTAQFRTRIPATPADRPTTPRMRAVPADDPYGS
jgi:hypothetical protein